MKITKEGDELVIRVPLKGQRSNPWDDNFHEEFDCIVGVIAGDDIGFANWIDMDYAGKPDQVSDIFIKTDHLDEEQFKKLCEELNLDLVEYPLCSKCGKVIYGSCTWGEKGQECYDCKI